MNATTVRSLGSHRANLLGLIQRVILNAISSRRTFTMPASKAPNRYPQNRPLHAESYRIALPPIDCYHENPFTDALLKHLSLGALRFPHRRPGSWRWRLYEVRYNLG